MKAEQKSAPDAGRVYTVIAAIMSRRGSGNVNLIEVHPVEQKKAG